MIEQSDTRGEQTSEKRQRFHVVQLAMFNADVLAGVQRQADEGDASFKSLLDGCAKRNISSTVLPSTVNQSVFFQIAYLTLVWLRESLSTDEVNQALSSSHMINVWDAVSCDGPRNVDSAGQKMRLLRNALSHGNVSIDDAFIFEFWDQNQRRSSEAEPTYLRISAVDLGKLTQKFYYAVSGVLYK